MIILAWFIIVFSFLQFLVALINLLFQPKYSKSEKSANSAMELVSVLIPARNEENNIGQLLADIQNQDYSNIEIIVFNDQSSDQTASIVNEFVKKDHRIKLINSNELPENWLGKNYACHILGNEAHGKFLLFLDADVRIKKRLIVKTVRFFKNHQLSLLSIFPHQIMDTPGEKISVPNMHNILLTLLPLILVRKTKFASLSAANGQFMLFDTATYKLVQPHEKVKLNKAEDIQIARILKKQQLKVACHASTNEISCRMYQSLNEAVNGFSKNVIMFFGNSYFMAILFWLITTFGFLVVILFLPVKIFFVYLSFILITRIFVSKISHQNWLTQVILLPAQQITLGLFIYKAVKNNYRKQFKWKGRNISY
ncbi:MAG: glycosyltransferase family 2 protein [Prolixibacteraceae bacterium]|nr:glycosyltransferase family 2 protein [Prolixibacteraceae bacterium]